MRLPELALFRKGNLPLESLAPCLLLVLLPPSKFQLSTPRNECQSVITEKPKLLLTRHNMKTFGLCNNHLSYKRSIVSKVSEKKQVGE